MKQHIKHACLLFLCTLTHLEPWVWKKLKAIILFAMCISLIRRILLCCQSYRCLRLTTSWYSGFVQSVNHVSLGVHGVYETKMSSSYEKRWWLVAFPPRSVCVCDLVCVSLAACHVICVLVHGLPEFNYEITAKFKEQRKVCLLISPCTNVVMALCADLLGFRGSCRVPGLMDVLCAFWKLMVLCHILCMLDRWYVTTSLSTLVIFVPE